MTLDEYQREAMRTAGNGDLAIWALGVAGEAGEVADMVKKIVGHGHPMDREKLVKELGDVLWYVAVLADKIGAPLREVAVANMAKLRARYPDGFSEARSLNREAGE
jgi:NTP pyrophosphatase (non-canonical NTP hydrolase)